RMNESLPSTIAFPSWLQAAAERAGERVFPKLAVRALDFHYGDVQALRNIGMDIPDKKVTAIIGPSGCGKSTLLRIFNRIYAIYPGLAARGEILVDGVDVLDPAYSVNRLRSKIGMVFQKPVPFPMTIFENVAYGI